MVKKGFEKKKKKNSIGPGTGIPGGDNNGNEDNNVNMRITGNTVTSPGEGLSENFNVNTVSSNNIA